MKQCIVTGGAGFIGSHLVESLVNDDVHVMVVDDFSNGRLSNLEAVADKIDIIKYDLSQPLDHLIEEVGSHETIDGIFHLACHPRSFSLKDPFRDMEVNARGTLNVLELAKRNPGCKVVFTSNSGIYGEPLYLPIDENHPDNPTTPYDANKLVAEYYCKIYHAMYHVPIAICRLATVFGERQRTSPIWKPVIMEFISQLANNNTPTIFWDGTQTRDFIYVQDVVSGLRKAFAAITGDEVFILGTGIETSINEVYDIVSGVLGKDIDPVRKEKIAGDIKRMQYSSRKAEQWFGFSPEYTLGIGITQMSH